MAITEAELKATLGKNISTMCTTGFTAADVNHCAHYVSHMLGIHFGYQCNGTRNRQGAGVSVRCDEIYNRVASRGALAGVQPQDGWLIFATSPGNMTGTQMGQSPRKHVGIYFSGKVYNYKNDEDKVVDDTLAHFHNRLKTAYSDQRLALYYAAIP